MTAPPEDQGAYRDRRQSSSSKRRHGDWSRAARGQPAHSVHESDLPLNGSPSTELASADTYSVSPASPGGVERCVCAWSNVCGVSPGSCSVAPIDIVILPSLCPSRFQLATNGDCGRASDTERFLLQARSLRLGVLPREQTGEEQTGNQHGRDHQRKARAQRACCPGLEARRGSDIRPVGVRKALRYFRRGSGEERGPAAPRQRAIPPRHCIRGQ
jgi:hypothetical protein